MRVLLGFGLAAVAVAVLAGCGGSGRLSKDEYRARLRAADRAIDSITRATITDATESGWIRGSPRAQRAALELDDTFARVERTLAGLRPPKDVEQDNREVVLGLRETAHTDTVLLLGGDARDYAAFSSGHVDRRYERAEKDLQAKGYEPRPAGYSFSVEGGGTSRQAKPFPFAVVSRAGRQAASELNASFCPPQPVGEACGLTAVLEPATGPRPGGFTVVRPGERVRISVAHPDEVLISLLVQRPCTFSLKGSRDFVVEFGLHPAWRVNLPPGRYVATFQLYRPTRRGDTQETGVVGLLVSRTARERIIRAPSCG